MRYKPVFVSRGGTFLLSSTIARTGRLNVKPTVVILTCIEGSRGGGNSARVVQVFEFKR